MANACFNSLLHTAISASFLLFPLLLFARKSLYKPCCTCLMAGRFARIEAAHKQEVP